MPETISIPAQKHRHILVTLYLWLMLLVNAIAAFTQFGQINDLQMRGISFSLWIIPLIVVAHLANLTCIVALFCWKKWGFWFLVVPTILNVFVKLLHHDPLDSVLGAGVGMLILYAVLQAGDENRAWPQLE
jgi:hypothetical protein